MLLLTAFGEDIVLLVVAALLSGLVVPSVLKRIDERRTIALKDRENALARQAKIIDAQSELLDSLTTGLWRWRYVVIKVTYYGIDGDKYDSAQREYDSEVWPVLNDVRREISRARRLLSEKAYTMLEEFYRETMIEAVGQRLDRARSDVYGYTTAAPDSRDAWLRLNRYIYDDVSRMIDDVLNYVADDAGLAVGRDTQCSN